MKSGIIIFVILALILFITGCRNSPNLEKSNEGDNIKNVTEVNGEPMVSEDIQIYKIKRDTLISFLENPSLSVLNNKSTESYVYSDEGEWYVKHNVSRIKIEQQFVDFVGNRSEIEKYLNDNNVNGAVKDVAVFEAPNTPITIWVETEKEDVFITVSEEPFEDLCVYRFYDQSDYTDRYNAKDADLIINGKTVESETTVKLYYDYADIPLTVVLRQLGAKVEWQSGTKAAITFIGENYVLDTNAPTLYKNGEEGENLLYKTAGGPTFIYSNGKELMVDSTTLNCVLREMGETVRIECDSGNSAVTIEARDG